MCLSTNSEGLPDGGMEGVRRRYFLWLEGTRNGVWNSAEDLEEHTRAIREHREEVLRIKDPQFGYC